MAKKKDNTVWIIMGIILFLLILGGIFILFKNIQLSPIERLEKLMESRCSFSIESPEPTIFAEDFSELQEICEVGSLERVYDRVCIADINGRRSVIITCLNFEELKELVSNLPPNLVY